MHKQLILFAILLLIPLYIRADIIEEEMQELVAIEVVTPDFYLGRVNGVTGFNSSVSFGLESGYTAIAGQLSGAIGTKDLYEVALRGVRFYRVSYDSSAVLLSDVNGVYQPRNNSRLLLSFEQNYLESVDEENSGSFRGSLGWRNLNRDGEIYVEESEHTLAFLGKPLLEYGQLYSDGSLAIQSSESFTGVNPEFTFAYGVSDRANVSLYGSLNSLSSDSYSELQVLLLPSVQYRNSFADVKGEVGHVRISSDEFTRYANLFGGTGSFLLHESKVRDAVPVAANWDGFYSPFLFGREVLFHVSGNYVSIGGDGYASSQYFETAYGGRFGINDHFILGILYRQLFNFFDEDPDYYLYESFTHQIDLNLMLHNVELRRGVEADYSILEQVHGRTLQKGEVVFTATGIAPFFFDSFLNERYPVYDPFAPEQMLEFQSDIPRYEHLFAVDDAYQLTRSYVQARMYAGITDDIMVIGGFEEDRMTALIGVKMRLHDTIYLSSDCTFFPESGFHRNVLNVEFSGFF